MYHFNCHVFIPEKMRETLEMRHNDIYISLTLDFFKSICLLDIQARKKTFSLHHIKNIFNVKSKITWRCLNGQQCNTIEHIKVMTPSSKLSCAYVIIPFSYNTLIIPPLEAALLFIKGRYLFHTVTQYQE